MSAHNQNRTQQWGEGYIDVATRIVEFRTKYPEGSLRPFNPDQPVQIITIEGKTFLQYVACAYRDPHDAAPGIGVAWEPFPGRTPFTRDSEAMVAETSAWGRAIVACLAADTKKGIASAEEVRVAKARRETPAAEPAPAANWEPEEEPAAKVGAKQIQRIQILRRQIPSLLDDDVYHDRLTKAYGVSSTKDLTPAQATDLIKKLEKASEAVGQ
jgi:hypothetical protein